MVAVVTRSNCRAEMFRQQGYEAIVADVTRPETLRNLPVSESVLFSVGFDRASNDSIEAVYAGVVINLLATLSAEIVHLRLAGV